MDEETKLELGHVVGPGRDERAANDNGEAKPATARAKLREPAKAERSAS